MNKEQNISNSSSNRFWLFRFASSLYSKISLIFLLLLLGLGLAQSVRWRYAQDRSAQLLNLGLAQKIAERLAPALDQEIDDQKLLNILFELKSLYDGVDVYLISKNQNSDQGKVIGFLGEPWSLVRPYIDLKPIKKFLNASGPGQLPIFGEDPLSEKGKSVFSAADLQIGAQQAYLYAVFGAEHQAKMRDEVMSGFTSGSGTLELMFMMLVTASLGLILFFILTRRFHRMTEVVKAFRAGNLSQRVMIDGRDEISDLAKAFDEMADTIQADIIALNEKDNLRRQVVANISHDLRTPLTSLSAFVETIKLRGDSLPEEKRKHFIDNIYESAQTLERMVSDLFELSKLEAKDSEPQMAKFSILELSEAVRDTFSIVAEKKGLSLELVSPESVSEVFADQIMIERVLFNLISNAIRHTASGGSVKIILEEKAEKVLLSVADTGSGIPKDELPFIFERFYQVGEQAEKRKRGGSGLGLAIVKKIIEAHQSQISVTSEINQGTRFTFSLGVVGRVT